jgi:hypothetical protein
VNKSLDKTLVAFFAIALAGVPQPLRAVQASSQPVASTPALKSEQRKKTEKEPPPTNPAERKDKDKDKDHGLEIDKIDPEVLIASDSPQDQILTVSGATDGETLTVVYKSPDSKSQLTQQAASDKGVAQTSVKLDIPGIWWVTVSKKDASSPPRSFKVQEPKSTCRTEASGPRVLAFWEIFKVMNRILAALLVALFVGLIFAACSKTKWSLGDALSEESSSQPKEITGRDQVVMVASSSRIIAVFGLSGILVLVVGIGYSIVWNLVVCGTSPNLSPIKAFLVGMAAVFAPYLANQLRETFSPSNPIKKEEPKAKAAVAGTVKIGYLVPASPRVEVNAQDLNFLGSEFQAWMSVTLTDPDGHTVQVLPQNLEVSGPTQCRVTATLDRGGNWKAVVTMPNGASSPPFVFGVRAPAPAIGGLVPPNPAANAVALTVNGNDLMPNVVTTLITPNGIESKPHVTWTNRTQIQLAVVLQNGNGWRIRLSNPGCDQTVESAPFNVT